MAGNTWYITATGDQTRWQDFCEEFMSEDIEIVRRYVDNAIVVTCQIRLNPFESIDSTKSMPSFVTQATREGFVLSLSTRVELSKNDIIRRIGEQFRTFGGGDSSLYLDPVACALKDRPLQFAAGVDVSAVVEFVVSQCQKLKES